MLNFVRIAKQLAVQLTLQWCQQPTPTARHNRYEHLFLVAALELLDLRHDRRKRELQVSPPTALAHALVATALQTNSQGHSTYGNVHAHLQAASRPREGAEAAGVGGLMTKASFSLRFGSKPGARGRADHARDSDSVRCRGGGLQH